MNKIIFVTLAILFFVNLTGCSNRDSKQRITLMEAYEKSEENALEWSYDAELAHITSVDNPAIKDSGYGGKRLTWTAIFHSRTRNESIVLSIKNNKVTTLVVGPEKIGKEALAIPYIT